MNKYKVFWKKEITFSLIVEAKSHDEAELMWEDGLIENGKVENTEEKFMKTEKIYN